MFKHPSRYKVDSYKNLIVDTRDDSLVCEVSAAEKHFSKRPTKIHKKVKDLQLEISRLRKEIDELMEQCPHTHTVHAYGGNTGNWSKSDDCYWIDFKCYDCGKRWTKYQ